MTSFSTLRIYSPFLRRIRGRLVASILGFAGAAATEAVALAAIGILATREFTNLRAGLFVVGTVPATLMASALLRALAEAQLSKAQIELEFALRREMTDAILAADWQVFVDQPGHELQSAVISEAPQVAQATVSLARGLG